MKYCLLDNTVCFAGHRSIRINENILQTKLADFIISAINKGFKHFICGGAVGFDMLAAEQVCFFKDLLDDITLEIAVPCKEQEKQYSKVQKLRYNFILSRADKVTKRNLPYNRYCISMRNKYMVNNSSLIIAYYDGTKGITQKTIEYAKNKEKEMWLI